MWSAAPAPSGLPAYLQSGGAPRVFFTGVSKWAPRGGPVSAGPLSWAGAVLPFQCAGLCVRSAAPAPSRALSTPSDRRRGVRKGSSVGADSVAGVQSRPPFCFSFPREPVGPWRKIGACLPRPLTSTGSSGSKGHGESRNGIPCSAKPR
ncbi:hypothetical protein NDU88_004244 [Pleurodeles waltl]|uniref:Uncharacterized protein n=1 Tax=Pleurodeles waltl TaxID=8319 RepID=A0AAV7V0Q1_PLEWA|nr:hypothetical protein NDU88_004244 [Pleurodeles waltl]